MKLLAAMSALRAPTNRVLAKIINPLVLQSSIAFFAELQLRVRLADMDMQGMRATKALPTGRAVALNFKNLGDFSKGDLSWRRCGYLRREACEAT